MQRNKVDKEAIIAKNDIRSHFNMELLGISFGIFTLIISLKPELLLENKFIALQLVLSIPLFVSSIFARIKSMYTYNDHKMFSTYGFVTFIIGYAFLINVIGIFISIYVTSFAAVLFFLVNILLSFLYSKIEIKRDHTSYKSRLIKDFSFWALIVIFGILPVLGVY